MKLVCFQKLMVVTLVAGLGFWSSIWAQNRPIVIQGGTLIDGTGRAPIMDSVVVIRDGKFHEVGKRGEVTLPQGAEVIDAKGKTVLPGLIDGHCHYRDWMGEVYLAYGATVWEISFEKASGWFSINILASLL